MPKISDVHSPHVPSDEGAYDADMVKRTTHKSTGGKKLYAVRSKKGSFKDIQSYKRAHGSDIKRKAKNER